MKYFLPFLMAFLFWSPIKTSGCKKVAARALKASVVIHVKGIALSDTDHKVHKVYITCSGTYVSDNSILSAAHCFADYIPVYVWVRDASSEAGVPATVVLVDSKKDLSLLKTKNIVHSFSKLGKEPKIGEAVVNVGSPTPFEFLVTEGIVAMKIPGHFMTTAFVDHGSSGGGAFDNAGRLIGVNVWKFAGGITGAVNVAAIKEFLIEGGVIK